MSVIIRSVPGKVNPTPKSNGIKSDKVTDVEAEKEFQDFLDGIIGEDYLQKVTNTTDLSTITSLKLKVDTSSQSIYDISEHLPNLTSLVLDSSLIATVRDLGIGYKSLKVLSLNDCGLTEIDGIHALSGLQELSLCDNDISDVTPLAMHETLTILKLSGNKLSDLSIADALSSCPKLKSLFLNRNLIEKAPRYRLLLSSLIPSLQLLDGSPVDPNAQSKVSNGMILEAASAMSMVIEDLEDEQRLEMLILEDDVFESTIAKQKNGTSETDTDTGSDLTHGTNTVLAGNVALAMRRRRAQRPGDGSAEESAIDMLDSVLGTKKAPATLSANSSSSSYPSPSLKASYSGSASGVDGAETLPFFNEGDITEAVAAHLGLRPLDVDYDDEEDEGEDANNETRFGPGSASGSGARPGSRGGQGQSQEWTRQRSTGNLSNIIASGPKLANMASSPLLRRPPSRSSLHSSKGGQGRPPTSSFDSDRGSSRTVSRSNSGMLSEDPNARPRSRSGRRERGSGRSGEGGGGNSSGADSRSSSRPSSRAGSREGNPDTSIAAGTGTGGRTDSKMMSRSQSWSRTGESSFDIEIIHPGGDGGTSHEDFEIHSNNSSRPSSSRGNSRPSSSRGEWGAIMSPRQLNGSRPTTAAQSLLESGLFGSGAGATTAAPFLVAANADEVKSYKARMGSMRRGMDGNDSPPTIADLLDKKKTRVSASVRDALSGGGRNNSSDDDDDDDSGDEGHAAAKGATRDDRVGSRRRVIGFEAPKGTHSGPDASSGFMSSRRNSGSSSSINSAMPHSIVHLDLVRRNVCEDFERAVSGRRDDEEEDEGDCEDVDDDLEGIAVTHAARHRLMSASGSRSSLHAHAQAIPTLSSGPTGAAASGLIGIALGINPARRNIGVGSDGEDEDDDDGVGGGVGGAKVPPQRAFFPSRGGGAQSRSSKTSIPSVSSMAGVGLGFDLKGSLAAIEQWVDQMESEDDLDDDRHEDEEGAASSKSAKFKRPPSVLSAVGAGAGAGGPMRSPRGAGHEVDPNPGYKSSRSSTSLSDSTKETKILTRDSILSMCNGNDQEHDLVIEGSDNEEVAEVEAREVAQARDRSGKGKGKGASSSSSSSSSAPLPAPTPLRPPVITVMDDDDEEAFLQLLDEELHLQDEHERRGGGDPKLPGGCRTDPDVAAAPTFIRIDSDAVNRSKKLLVQGNMQARRIPVVKSSATMSRPGTSSLQVKTSLGLSLKGPKGKPDSPAILAPLEVVGPANEAGFSFSDAGGRHGLASPARVSSEGPKAFGDGVFMNDADLIALLRLPPKSTPQLRTKGSFQEFFRGIGQQRIQSLLEKAYEDAGSLDERNQKVGKRMDLLKDVVIK